MSVHNLEREPMHPGDVSIGRRPTIHFSERIIGDRDRYFGNPFVIGPEWSGEAAIAQFARYAQERVATDPDYRDRVRGLHGKRLFCSCKPLACHSDVLEQLAAELAGQEWDPEGT